MCLQCAGILQEGCAWRTRAQAEGEFSFEKEVPWPSSVQFGGQSLAFGVSCSVECYDTLLAVSVTVWDSVYVSPIAYNL